ncbi:MAG: hypothetical protein J2O39_00460 [Acidimicrobiales bacterium]|nr:hypothetical protein [Acidimicrobiales bacterium]MBO0886926.1 hypothetical protein [Acidimicrobiales bacterium]MBO0892822.1 hypothetical protein [Acidimicrobiales bacterium]
MRPAKHLLARLAPPLVAAAITSSVVAACSSSPDAAVYGRQACQEVNRSIALFERSQSQPPATAARMQARALAELRAALQPASLANATSGMWQPLMATLSESNRVPEANLIAALRQQCAADLGGSG